MRRPKAIRERLRNTVLEAVAENKATPRAILRPVGVMAHGTGHKPVNLGYRAGPDTKALESNTHTGTFWLHHTGMQHSSPLGYVATALLREQPTKVDPSELSYPTVHGMTEKQRRVRYRIKDKELYRQNVTLAPAPVPESHKAKAPTPRKTKRAQDMDEFDLAAERARKYLSTFGDKGPVKPSELPSADA